MLAWKLKYPVKPTCPKGRHDPTKIRCSPLRCVKCGKTEKISRHHKGNEFYLAVVAEHFYAARYVQFRATDVVPLCLECHGEIHTICWAVMDELRAYIADCLDYVEEDNTPVWRYKPQYKVLESYRRRMVSKCDRWLNKQLKRRRKRKRK